MKFSAASVLALATSASAFTPSANKAAKTTELQYSEYWTPDESAFACGLPGSLDPVGDFDPLGFADGADAQKMKNYREAELQHGRVAMLGALGMLVTEEPIEYHPLFQASNKDIGAWGFQNPNGNNTVNETYKSNLGEDSSAGSLGIIHKF